MSIPSVVPPGWVPVVKLKDDVFCPSKNSPYSI